MVLAMLGGKHADTRVRELRRQVYVDRLEDTVAAPKEALRLIYHSGGTIPDRGYYGLKVRGTAVRLGELDEEFVRERKIGETFVFGNKPWKILEIGDRDVEVAPAASPLRNRIPRDALPGAPGALLGPPLPDAANYGALGGGRRRNLFRGGSGNSVRSAGGGPTRGGVAPAWQQPDRQRYRRRQRSPPAPPPAQRDGPDFALRPEHRRARLRPPSSSSRNKLSPRRSRPPAEFAGLPGLSFGG